MEEKNLEEKQKEFEGTLPPEKKQKNTMLLFLIVIILVLAIAGVVYYFKIYTNPQKIYQGFINKGLESMLRTEEDISTMKLNTKLDLNIDLDMELPDETEEVLDLINKTKMDMDLQMDTEKKQVFWDLNSEYDKEDLLDMKILIDAAEEKSYIELHQFFEDILEVEVEEEMYESLVTTFEPETLTFGQEINEKKAKKIIKNEFEKSIKKDYCSKTKEEIKVDGKEIKTDVYILEFTLEQYFDELKAILNNLKDNEDYLSCFKDKAETKENLEEAINVLEELYAEDLEDFKLYFKLYRKGLIQEVVRFDLEMKAEKEKISLRIMKQEDGYKFELGDAKQTYIEGNIKIAEINKNEKRLQMNIDMEDVGKFDIDMEYGYVTGEPIDTLDTDDAVNIEKISEDDLIKASEKLEDSKLYELVEKFSSLSVEDDYNYDYDLYDQENDYDNSKKTNENEIITYMDEIKVKFNIEEGYKLQYATDNYKTFTKDDISVTITNSYSEKKEMLEEAQDYKEFYEEYEYKNINLTEEKSIVVNGKTFYYVELSYEAYGLKYNDIYLCTEISDDEMYTVEIETEGKTFEEIDVEGFLNINF